MRSKLGIAALFVVSIVLSACGGSSNSNPPDNRERMPLERVENASCVAPATSPLQQGALSLEAQYLNLPRLPGLLGMFQAPGDDSLWYAMLRQGRIESFVDASNVTDTDVFLDISDKVSQSGEMGLLGFAFHPNFASNGQFFVSYSDRENDGRSTISRFTFDGTTPVPTQTEEVILTLDQPASNHNGGAINFGSDGYLYIGFGDGGGSNDAFGHGQNTLTLHGALLRIDVNGDAPYEIPSDNPFVGDNNFAPEIFAYGLRNPWRWSFDIQTSELWLADVGQNRIEEIDIVNSGDNLGWPIMEGSECFQSANCDEDGLVLPVGEYLHENGDCSITGGYVYRSTRLLDLQGSYFSADFCTGRIRRTTPLSGNQFETAEVLVSGRNIAAFAQDNSGEVYVLNSSGDQGDAIFRFFVNNSDTDSTMPDLLSETGCYQSTQNKTLAPGVVPYEVSSALWSDGAEKERFFAIPNNTTIDIASDGDFDFPVGTVLVKNFFDDTTILETRLFVQHDNGWAGYSYEWLNDLSDAVLLDTGKTINSDNFVHTFPSSEECASCHTSAAGFSLGLEAGQLNGNFTYPGSGETANQLDALFDAGYLSALPTENQRQTLPGLTDESASLEARARSYLHTNCSGCHRPDAPGSIIDLRVSTDLVQTGACDQVPATDDYGIDEARVIAPGSADRSVLLSRMEDLGAGRMPPLASLVVDEQAVALIGQWINSLTTCD